LSKHILVLNDWVDADIVLIEKPPEELEPKMIWTSIAGLYSIMEGNRSIGDVDVYENFASWVVDRYELLKED
jgi:hypothetical protein